MEQIGSKICMLHPQISVQLFSLCLLKDVQQPGCNRNQEYDFPTMQALASGVLGQLPGSQNVWYCLKPSQPSKPSKDHQLQNGHTRIHFVQGPSNLGSALFFYSPQHYQFPTKPFLNSVGINLPGTLYSCHLNAGNIRGQ